MQIPILESWEKISKLAFWLNISTFFEAKVTIIPININIGDTLWTVLNWVPSSCFSKKKKKEEKFNKSFEAGSYLFQEHLLLEGGEHVGLSPALKNQSSAAPAMVEKTAL